MSITLEEALEGQIPDLTAKSNPVGADTLALIDSENSDDLKKATLADIKRAVLGYREYRAKYYVEGGDPLSVSATYVNDFGANPSFEKLTTGLMGFTFSDPVGAIDEQLYVAEDVDNNRFIGVLVGNGGGSVVNVETSISGVRVDIGASDIMIEFKVYD